MTDYEDQMFGQPLPPAPVSGGGLPRTDEVLWFKRLSYARNQLEAALPGKEHQKWFDRFNHCRNFITASNMALAIKLTNHFAAMSMANFSVKDDMQSEANEALGRAVDKFRLKFKVRFGTFAYGVVTKAVLRAVKKETTVRRRFMTASSDEKSFMGVHDRRQMDGQMAFENIELLHWAMKNAKLSMAELNVLDMRFRQSMKLHEIGDVLGLSKERIRQIETKAVAKLRETIKAEMR